MASDSEAAIFTAQIPYLDTPEVREWADVIRRRHGISLAKVMRYATRHGMLAAEAVEVGEWRDDPRIPVAA